MATDDYTSVTEMAGTEISRQQLESIVRRYRWAGDYSQGKDVLEAACGTGPGLIYLGRLAKRVIAGDYSPSVLEVGRRALGGQVELRQFDAQDMPFEDGSFDVVILFEAIYYLPSADKFMAECRRVLRPGGVVLHAVANKDLYDFNPSPYSYKYYGVVELGEICRKHGFDPEFFAAGKVNDISLRERILRPVKKLAVAANLIPKTMGGKKILKRLVFGSLVPMPVSIADIDVAVSMPTPIEAGKPNKSHKVIYCVARRT